MSFDVFFHSGVIIQLLVKIDFVKHQVITNLIIMKLTCAVVLLSFVTLVLAVVDDVTLPHWQNLECEVGDGSLGQVCRLKVYLNCQKGHKYLFSEEVRSWLDAKEECELYGGWLVDIRSQAEANCLMRYGMSLGVCHGYWTDGRYL